MADVVRMDSFGHYQSWSFNIGVKAASLADLKYDKSQSMFDNLY